MSNNRMFKKELTEKVYENCDGVTKTDVAIVVSETLKALGDTLVDTDKDIVIPGFGIFRKREVKGRQGVDFNGVAINIPAYEQVNFKASEALKKRLKGSEKEVNRMKAPTFIPNARPNKIESVRISVYDDCYKLLAKMTRGTDVVVGEYQSHRVAEKAAKRYSKKNNVPIKLDE